MDVKISPQLIAMFENNSDPWGIKIFDGNQSFHFYSNHQNYKLFNLPLTFNLLGKTDSEIPHPISEFSENFQAHDFEILKQKRNITSIDIYPYGKDSLLQPYICEKFPFIIEGKCIGVMFHSRKMELLPFRKFKNLGKSIETSDCYIETEFTEKEFEVMFLMTHSFTTKEISKILCLSYHTVNNKLQSIYQKLGINFREQLIEYCINKNIHNKIPMRFLKPRSYLLN
ncbi:MAG: LuxR C-terminal-related transcriptional regulator [Coxiella endosymbiont of Dermacentor nuttalli]